MQIMHISMLSCTRFQRDPFASAPRKRLLKNCAKLTNAFFDKAASSGLLGPSITYVGFNGEGEGSTQKRTSLFMASFYSLKWGGGVCKSTYLGVRTLWTVPNFVKKDISVHVSFARCFGEM